MINLGADSALDWIIFLLEETDNLKPDFFQNKDNIKNYKKTIFSYEYKYRKLIKSNNFNKYTYER